MGQLREFIEKVMSDEGLKTKLDALGKKEGDNDVITFEKEDIIALAKDYGFTITAEEIIMRKNGCTPDKNTTELNGDELDAITGGGWPTQNRYDPKTCKNMTRTKYNCVGFLEMCYCDHFRYDRAASNSAFKLFWYWCEMNAYPKYKGDADGTPVK